MPVLSTSWTKLNEKTVSISGFTGTFSIWAKIIDTDIPNNKTKVQYDWDLNISYGWVKSYGASDYVTGAGWNAETYREYLSSGTLRSGTEWLTHNNDGTKSSSCSGRTIMSAMGVDTDWVSGSFTLPTIPRASKPTINTQGTSTNTFVLGDQITIYTNRKITNATHTIIFTYPKLVNGQTQEQQVTVSTNAGESVTYNTSSVAQEILNSYPNLGVIQGTVKCTTYSSNTQIGSIETISYTASVPDTARPNITFGSIIEESAANGGLAGKSVGNNTVVRYISKKKVTATIAGQFNATITRAYITDNSGVGEWNMTASGSTYTASFDNISTANLTIVAIDSRGKETRFDIPNLTLIPYERPTIRRAYFERTNNSTGAAKIVANGSVYRGQTIGNVSSNVATVNYILYTSSPLDQQVPSSAITYSGSDWQTTNSATLPINLTPTESYTGVISVTDSFNQTVSFDVMVPSTQNVAWFGKKTVRVHDVLIADTDVWLNDGAIKLSDLGAFKDEFTDLAIRNYSWYGSWSNSSSTTRTLQITGKGLVMINIYVRNGGTTNDDTGQCEAAIALWNTSNVEQYILSASGNRVSTASTHRIAANAATQYYYDGSSANRRLRCILSCTKNGTNDWRIQATAIGCTLAAV